MKVWDHRLINILDLISHLNPEFSINLRMANLISFSIDQPGGKQCSDVITLRIVCKV